MHKTQAPDPEFAAEIKQEIENHGLEATAAARGIHHNTLAKVARGVPVSKSTLRKLGAGAGPKVREREDFKGAAATIQAPKLQKPSAFAWNLEAIISARNDQMRGDFERPVRLAEAFATNDALFTARENRVAPQSALQAILKPAGDSVRAKAIAKKAEASIVTPRSVLSSINTTLADHGLAIGYVEHEVESDGSLVNMQLTEWPLEFVKYDTSLEALTTRVRDGAPRETIIHGNSKWIVFKKRDSEPWKKEACVLPGALVFATHGFAIRDWARASVSHGNAKIIGELPENVPLQDSEGNLTPEAKAFLTMLANIVGDGDEFAGLRTFGSKTDFISNSSTAWQVFKELLLSREKGAARIYLGTDGMLGSVGGAPGVDIAQLFGVATTKIQGDLEALERGLYSGLYVPWTAINIGDSRLAPRLSYQLPDPDADAKAEGYGKRRAAFFDDLNRQRDQGFTITQDSVNALAARYNVDPPTLAEIEKQKIKLELAPTDVAKVVLVKEARQGQGLPPFGDARDDLTVAEFAAQVATKGDGSPGSPGVAPEVAPQPA